MFAPAKNEADIATKINQCDLRPINNINTSTALINIESQTVTL